MKLYIFHQGNKVVFDVKEGTPIEDCFKWASQFHGTKLVSISNKPIDLFDPVI